MGLERLSRQTANPSNRDCSEERQLVKRVLLWILSPLVAAFLLVFVGDYLSLRFRIPGGRAQFGQVVINPLYAIPVKGGKVQYEPGQQETDTCVHSLFPHFGDPPCWYLIKHTDRVINI